MRRTHLAGKTSLCVAKFWKDTSSSLCPQRKHLHLPKVSKLSRSPPQHYGTRDSSSTLPSSHSSRPVKNLRPLSLGLVWSLDAAASYSLALQGAGASPWHCSCSVMLNCFLRTCSSFISLRPNQRATSRSSQAVSYFGGTTRFRELQTRPFSVWELRYTNMSSRQLRVRKETTTQGKTVVKVHTVRNGSESTKKSPRARNTVKKEVKILVKDNFAIDSWQYQLLERHECNNVDSYTVAELRALLREMKRQPKGQKPELLKAVRSWLSENGCQASLASEEDQNSEFDDKSLLESSLPKVEDNAPKRKAASKAGLGNGKKKEDSGSTTPSRVKRRKQATNGELGDIVESKTKSDKPDKPSPKVKASKKGPKVLNGKEAISKESVLKIGTLTDENKEAWTVLVHKKPLPEWLAYNPATMRPEPPSANEKVMKLLSWNVNGLRALLKGKGMEQDQGSLIAQLAAREDFDVLCLQETKLQEKDVEQIRESLLESHEESLWSCSTSKLGYSGTAIISRVKPLSVLYGLGIADHDHEGRTITCEFDSFYIVGSYVPNSGDGLKRLAYRTEEWDPALSRYLKELEKKKPVVLTGDLNCAFEEIDIHHPAGNKRSAGFTDEERESFKMNFLDQGFVDTFRRQHPNAVAYTYWGYRTAARSRNSGWRLDYFLVSESLTGRVHDSYTIPDVGGSDHCPIGLILKT